MWESEAMKDLCIYHGNCADGFTAAWAVWRKWKDKLEYIGASYGDAAPDLQGRRAIIVDFSYPFDKLDEMSSHSRRIVVLDHHKTAQAELARVISFKCDDPGDFQEAIHECWRQNCPELVAAFDMQKSGARMAWEHIHPGEAVPDLVRYVEDRDLWRWQLPDSRAVSAYIAAMDQTFETWDNLDALFRAGRADVMIEAGEILLLQRDKDIKALLGATTRAMVIGGYTVPVANIPFMLASDALARLVEGARFAASYYDSADGKRCFSLRSKGEFDVSEVAKLYGGGGHRNAAGFAVHRGWEGDVASSPNSFLPFPTAGA